MPLVSEETSRTNGKGKKEPMSDSKYKINVTVTITKEGAKCEEFHDTSSNWHGLDYQGVCVVEKALIGALGALNDVGFSRCPK